MKKIIVISVGLFLLPLFLFAQKEGDIGITFQKGNNNWGKGYYFVTWIDPNISESYIGSNYLKYADIITHIDGTGVRNMDEENFTTLCKGEIGSQVELTVLRTGSVEPIKIRVKRKLPLNALWGPYYFTTRINYNGSSDRYGWFMRLTNHIESPHQILSDKEIDFLRYKTFDFEYTNQQQPLIEKELAAILGDVLEEKGLVRDRENPDILVLIDFFSDQKEQYIPPAEKIYTRYETTINWFRRGSEYRRNDDLRQLAETKQYVESTTVGDYTRTKYLTLLNVAFIDANNAKDTDNKVPPVIWDATYEFTSDVKTTMLDDAKREYPLLLNSYPVISWQLNLAYYDWGIYVDKDNTNKIAKLIPNSFAEKIGLQENDIITMVRKVGPNILSGQNYKDDPMFHLHAFDNQFWYISKIKVNRNGKNKSFSIREPQPSIKRIIMSKPLFVVECKR
jgi:hypothetical protein